MVDANMEKLIQFLKTKFVEDSQTFLGIGPLASSTYINSEFQYANWTDKSAGQVKFVSSDDLYDDLICDGHGQECGNSGSNLIIGNSGLGKTSFALRICEIFWNKSEYNGRIPVYIHLPRVVEHFKENILEKWFTCKNLLQTFRECQVLLILDGFDELKSLKNNFNLFEANDWVYPNIKTVILSRNSSHQCDKTRLFQCFPKPSDDCPPFVEYLIQPFDRKQVDDYISKVDAFISVNSIQHLEDTPWGIVKLVYTERNWNKEKYFEWMKRLPDLRDLAETPLLLTLILQTLPVVVGNSDSIRDEVAKFSKTKVGIFDCFTKNWFRYQYDRLNITKLEEINHVLLNWPIFETFCYAFAQNLAYSLINRNRKLPKDVGRLQENVLLPAEVCNWNTLEIIKYSRGQIARDNELIWSVCLNLFKKSENSAVFEAIRNSCLVKFVQSNDRFLFQFFHRSIAEYFVSRDIFVELQGEFEYYLAEAEIIHQDQQDTGIRGLNKYILKEVAIQEYLAERVSSEPNFEDLLFKIIEMSKELSLISIMAANAISILNVSGVSFSDRNFEWIQIPGANLNHSLCGYTNFKGANLENVSFEDSWLAGAQFNGAKLRNSNFGLNSSFKFDPQQTPLSINFFQDWDTQKWFVYSSYYNYDLLTFKVIKWDLAQITKVLELTLQHEKGKDFCMYSIGFFVIRKYLIMWSEELCIFCVKTGTYIASVSIPEMPSGRYAGLPYIYEIMINEKKLFVARANRIFQYEFFDSLTKDPSNITLTLVQELYLEEDEDVKYEFTENLGLFVVWIEDNKFSIKETRYTVEFKIISFAIDPNRCHIALGGYEGILQIRDVKSCVIRKFKLTCAGVNILKYSTDFKFLAAGARDDTNGHFIQIWKSDDWICVNLISLGFSKVSDFQFWSSSPEEELILGVAFVEPQDGLQFFSVLLERSRMLTQRKVFPFYIETVSCSVDGTLIAGVLHKHRFASEKGPFLYHERPKQYIVHVWSVRNGKKMYEFEFEYDRKSSLLQMQFIVENKIICIERTSDGEEYFYIYDQTGSLIKNRILINYRENCGLGDDFSSTGFNVNHTGTLIARGLNDGSVCPSDVLLTEPFLRYKSHLKVPTKQKKIYYAAYFINFDKKSIFLVSSSDHDSLNTIYSAEKCTIRLWNIVNEQLLAEFCDEHFRLPQLHYFNDGNKKEMTLMASSFNSIELSLPIQTNKKKIAVYFDEFSPLVMPLFDYADKYKLIILYAGPKLVQLWNVSNVYEAKLLTAMHLWFDIAFLKFISHSGPEFDSNLCKILITGQSNICCVKFNNVDTSLSLHWSHTSNLSLTVKDLCLDQCIELCTPDYKELLARGATGSMAHLGQEYIAKSNIIVPILGSTLLEANTVFNAIIQRTDEVSPLKLSSSQWILSAIGRKSNSKNPFRKFPEKHVFLALEGIKRDKRFIFEAHLRYVKGSDRVYFQIIPTADVAAFQAKYRDCRVRQWGVTIDQGMSLIADILSDYQKMLMYKFFTKNCIKWTKEKIEKLGYNFEEKAIDLIVITPSALLDRKGI